MGFERVLPMGWGASNNRSTPAIVWTKTGLHVNGAAAEQIGLTSPAIKYVEVYADQAINAVALRCRTEKCGNGYKFIIGDKGKGRHVNLHALFRKFNLPKERNLATSWGWQKLENVGEVLVVEFDRPGLHLAVKKGALVARPIKEAQMVTRRPSAEAIA